MNLALLKNGRTFCVASHFSLDRFRILMEGQHHNLVMNNASKRMAFFLSLVFIELSSLFAFNLYMFMFKLRDLYDIDYVS